MFAALSASWKKGRIKRMDEKKIDLHMHSSYSDDGEFSPEQLVRQCAEAGVKVMAISDHNCARANEEARRAARAAGIVYISAIEIDCVFEGVNLHLLGYGIDDKSADFAEIEQRVRRQGGAASEKMLVKTRALGFDISQEEMEKVAADGIWQESWTGEMFAEVLLEKPEYQNHPLLLPYRAGGERSDNPFVNFYWDYYSQGKPCYAHIDYPSLARAMEIIHENGGRAVLAHPGINLKGRGELLVAIARGFGRRRSVQQLPQPGGCRLFLRRGARASLICHLRKRLPRQDEARHFAGRARKRSGLRFDARSAGRAIARKISGGGRRPGMRESRRFGGFQTADI